jgi:6-pyruvoyltetrahydropterin/6-carboxytetrahydropterin synthase
MFELTVERSFRAVHAIVMAGEREAPHEHDWRVTVAVRGVRLDGDGLLCDFHEVQRRLDDALATLRDADLNETPPFRELNPTAENVARHLHEAVAAGLPEGVSLTRVEVTEAPGCTATYFGMGSDPI